MNDSFACLFRIDQTIKLFVQREERERERENKSATVFKSVHPIKKNTVNSGYLEVVGTVFLQVQITRSAN